jgi:hypothetical protein
MRYKSLFLSVLFVTAFFIGGCGKADEEVGGDSAAIAAEFEQMLEDGSPLLALHEYLVEMLPQVSEEEAGAMLARYIKVLNYEETYWRGVEDIAMQDNDVIMEFYDYLEYGNDLGKINDENLRRVVADAVAVGLKWESPEGMPWTRPDYTKIANEFGKYSGDNVSKYLHFMSRLTDPPPFSDGGLVILWDELAKIIYEAEVFMVACEDEILRESVEEYYEWYLMNYFVGMDNSPVFAYDTGVIIPEVKASYESTMRLYPQSAFGENTQKYYAHLEANSFREPENNFDWLRENDLIVSYD